MTIILTMTQSKKLEISFDILITQNWPPRICPDPYCHILKIGLITKISIPLLALTQNNQIFHVWFTERNDDALYNIE